MLKKKDIIERYAQEMETSKKDATIIVDKVIELLKTGVINDGGVDLFGFISLEKSHRDARDRRNPRTGETVQVPAKFVPKAKFSSTFKRELNV